MVEVVFAFQQFPCFLGGRRPILVSGEAVCTLLQIRDGAPGNPPVIHWSVSSVECDAGKKRVRNFGGNKSSCEDFGRWLKGKHGNAVARALQAAHAATVHEDVETEE